MKPDEFEQRLSRQPLRPIPAEWRAEILSVARDAQESRHSLPVPRRSWLSTLNSQLSTIFWPHPAAWAGLAAIWIFISAVDFSIRDQTPMMAEKSAPPSPEVMAELRQQQRLLAELIGGRDTRETEPPKFLPQPRSERTEIMML
jgi:hypothetical protein